MSQQTERLKLIQITDDVINQDLLKLSLEKI